MDLRAMSDMSSGPYFLTFGLNTNWKGSGDVFFTIDNKTTLPNGERVTFPIEGTEVTQEVLVELKTMEQLRQLRIDVSDGPGAAVISNLHLKSSDGKLIKDWTPE